MSHVASRSRTWARVARTTAFSCATVEAPRPCSAVRASAASSRSRALRGQQPGVAVAGEDHALQHIADGLGHGGAAGRVEPRAAGRRAASTRRARGAACRRRSSRRIWRAVSSRLCWRWLRHRLRSSWSSRQPSAATTASTGTSGSSAIWAKGWLLARATASAGSGLVAAEAPGEEEARLEVLGLLRGAEGQEELGVHAGRPGLEAEADQERGVLAEPRVGAPGPAAPHQARRLAHRRRVRRGVEAAPRDVRLGVPAEPLGLAVQLAQDRVLGREAQREAPLHEALLLGLVAPQQPVARL